MPRPAMGRLIAIAAVVAAAAFLLHRWAWVPYTCNVRLVPARARAAYLIDHPRDPLVAVAAARDTLDQTRTCVERCPEQIEWLLIAAASERVIGRYDAAIATYRRALAIDERPEIYLELGQTQLDARQFDEAVTNLAVAMRFSRLGYLDEIPEQYRLEVKRKSDDIALVKATLRRRGAARTP